LLRSAPAAYGGTQDKGQLQLKDQSAVRPQVGAGAQGSFSIGASIEYGIARGNLA